MYENEYENYMRSVLGYSNNNTYNVNSFPYRANSNSIAKYEQMYPDIYNTIKPMVRKACTSVRIDNFSNEVIDELTDDIYSHLKSQSTASETRASKDSREHTHNNPVLRDLIKILVVDDVIKIHQNAMVRNIQPPYNCGNFF